MKAIVRYQVAGYSGEIFVQCQPDDEDKQLIARAKRMLRQRVGPLPFGAESWTVLRREGR